MYDLRILVLLVSFTATMAVSQNDKHVADLLNEAREFGLEGEPGLHDFITDYFVNPNNNSDDEDSESQHDDDADIEMESIASDEEQQNSETHSEHDSEDEHVDAVENEPIVADNEVVNAMNIAQEVYNVGDYDVGKCLCKCVQNCKEQFTLEERVRMRDAIAEMTPQEKDWVLLGVISASINDSGVASAGKRQTKERQRTFIRYKYGHRQICRDMFTYLFQISRTKLDTMKKHFLAQGFAPYQKKSGGRRKMP
ncbi:uncharacterized protein [Amphiura filiformis]|uniref:uncharacterized protein n=1 Tax=Amphiura filiformis TaxID=82378 RepID=UPI003B21129C